MHVRGIQLRPLAAIGQPLIQMPVVHFPFPDQEIEVVRRGIGRSGDLELTLSVEFHFGNRDIFVRRQLFVFRRSKMGKRQNQTDDQAISRNESVSHRSTKAKTGRQQIAVSSVAACLPSNAPKLSDRGWRGQAWSTEKGRPPASVRWSAWLSGGSFLALVMLPRRFADYRALWYRDGPLVAVGMVV